MQKAKEMGGKGILYKQTGRKWVNLRIQNILNSTKSSFFMTQSSLFTVIKFIKMLFILM